jgi:hypothetical protein
MRRSANQHGAEIELSNRPAELEERIRQHADQQDDLDFPDQLRIAVGKRDIRNDIDHPFRRAEQGDQPAQDQYRGRGEEGRSGHQAVERTDVADAVLVAEHVAEPLAAIDTHCHHEACRVAGLAAREHHVAHPAGDEPSKNQNVDYRNHWHGISCPAIAMVVAGDGLQRRLAEYPPAVDFGTKSPPPGWRRGEGITH